MELESVENIYTELNEINHVRERPDMYIGSVIPTVENAYVVNDGVIRETEIEYTKGMLKLIDEIISNSVDESKKCSERLETDKKAHQLTEINVTVTKDGLVTVRDNGGIPVKYHSIGSCYVPQYIFGRLRSGSNYNDKAKRKGVGRNGVGSSLANILSTEFNVSTCDGEAHYIQQWKSNMSIVGSPTILTKKVKNYTTKGVVINKGLKIESPLDVIVKKVNEIPNRHTEISYKMDMSMFKLDKGISDGVMKMVEMKCIFASATNQGITVTFNGTKYSFNSFDEYIKLYGFENIISGKSNQWDYSITPTETFKGNFNFSFVNGAECNQGEHVSHANTLIRNHIKTFMESKHNMKFTNENISSQYILFLNVDVVNPVYDGQTKEKLQTDRNNFDGVNGGSPIMTAEFLKSIEESSIVTNLIEWYNDNQTLKNLKDLKKLDKDNKKTKARDIAKLIDATATANRHKCDLWLFEGDSASNTFPSVRNPKTTGSYTLRGKLKNLYGKTKREISYNAVLNDIITALGLSYTTDIDVTKLRFGRIIIAVDADMDGICICAQLLAFFNEFYPQLIENGMVYSVKSPLYKIYKGKDITYYYSQDDFEKANKKGKNIEYFKGLGSLGKEEYREMVSNPRLISFFSDNKTSDTIKLWMGGGNSSDRKDYLRDLD